MEGEDAEELATASESDEGVVAGPEHMPLLVAQPLEVRPKDADDGAVALDGKRVYRCRNCGERGHNRVRCPRAPLDGGVTGAGGAGEEGGKEGGKEAKGKRRYRCGACGEDGHTKKKCPRLHEFGELSDEGGPAPPPPKRGSFHCSVCGKKGHTKRACPVRRAEWAVPQGAAAAHEPETVKQEQQGEEVGEREQEL
jgi:hypothetical protein